MGVLGLQHVIEPGEVVEESMDDPIYSHIIDRGDDQRHVQDILLEARIYGHTLTALCGYQFVPERDPQKYPVCDKCKEIFEFAKDFRGV